MPELPVLLVVATLVGGLVLMLRAPHEVADDEPPTLNTRGEQ